MGKSIYNKGMDLSIYIASALLGIFLGYFYAVYANRKTHEGNELTTIILIHEIRNQLTGLKWAFNLLTEKKSGETIKDEDIKLFKEGDKKINNTLEIVTDTFNIIKLGDGAAFNPENNNLIKITENCIDEYRIQAEERNVQIKMKVDGDLTNIVFDKTKMVQILRSIIGNAVKYSNVNGVVNVELESMGGYAKIAVSDNGIGIPKADQSRLFTRFFRAKNTDSQNGSGLGLYVAKKLVARHGGKIEVESIEGEGSKFTIIFPIK